MKFPKKLSKERLSLLSLEDRKIYEQEHSKDNQIEEFNIEEPLFEDDLSEDNELIQVDYEKIALNIISEELDSMYDDIFSDTINFNDFLDFKHNLLKNESFKNDEITDNIDIINEGAEGLDAFAWIRSFSGLNLTGLIGLVGAGLGLLSTGIAWLITQGKDRIAMMKLRSYMNRLSSIIDSGFPRKRSIFSFLMPKKNAQYHGDYSQGCFKNIQEQVDRNLAIGTMDALFKLGYFSQGNMDSISNAEGPQDGSGLSQFRDNLISQLNVIVRPVK